MKNILNLLILCGCFVLIGCETKSNKKDQQSNIQSVNEMAIPKPENDLNKIFKSDLLGANLNYLEKITGPAFKTYELKNDIYRNIYIVDNCRVMVNFKEKTIKAIGLERIDEKCTFDLNEFMSWEDYKYSNLNDINFGEISGKLGGSYYLDCISGCAASHDPTLYLHWTGGRAHRNWMEVLLEKKILDDKTYNNFFNVKNKLKAGHNNEWIMDGLYNCSGFSYTFQDMMEKNFNNEKIESILVGYDIFPEDEIVMSCE
ncbi:hypothetical protein GPS59_07525 [Acinetobacter haemolyticus]|uniref:hypothetical protein n=2 Tax=Acinetobacter haemolyticus TaxID=29430 RepID=UPI0012505F9F|nr:hypothetical protein [Acinetobacter haemolyticus]NAR53859.1 hypothetical protein [Acinetobacter haemolyticus]